ncbi:hypothetical protein HPB50_009970 [Hyalomma asiaticum]|uniref:Uncharacterized protein n=1 Tax=Hyalomma asiaticum TaxID=266040 RepID=A0ACB7S1I4_HYAAI|nr:hypothetical protein HPB50_009970 [Hyalomma asiaticum]
MLLKSGLLPREQLRACEEVENPRRHYSGPLGGRSHISSVRIASKSPSGIVLLLLYHRPSPACSAIGDYCSLLELPRNGSSEVILCTYRQLAMGRLPDKNPYNNAAAKARFKETPEAYEVLSSESKKPQYDMHDRGGQDSSHNVDLVRSRGVNAYNTGCAFTFTHGDSDELFRAFFGSWVPFQTAFRGMHGGPGSATVLTGRRPRYQRNCGSISQADFLIASDNLLFAPHFSASGIGGTSAGFVSMPAHQASSLLYVDRKSMETRTIIRDDLMTVLYFEDGQFVSHTVERAVNEITPVASPVPSREMPPYRQREDAPDFCAPSLFRGCVSAQPGLTTKVLSIKETAERPRKQKCQNELRWQGQRFL